MARPLTEGEEWAREQLAGLLTRRFSPAAIAGFLVASQQRANAVAAARPGLRRQAWTWMALGALPWALTRRPGLVWWSACAVMLDWHLGMIETEDGRPRGLGAADALTLGRAWLVPVAWERPTPLVCLLAAASDAADGALARRSEPTRIGRDLEGLVDFCFFVAALRGARRREWLGAAAATAEVARLSVGFLYALFAYFGRVEPPDARLTRAARATTPVRIGGLVAAGLGRRRLADRLVLGGAAGSVAVLALSARR